MKNGVSVMVEPREIANLDWDSETLGEDFRRAMAGEKEWMRIEELAVEVMEDAMDCEFYDDVSSWSDGRCEYG